MTLEQKTARLFKLVEAGGVSMMSSLTADQYKELLRDYPDITLVQEAVAEAGKNTRTPTPAYLRSVLERCVRERCRPGEWPNKRRNGARASPATSSAFGVEPGERDYTSGRYAERVKT